MILKGSSPTETGLACIKILDAVRCLPKSLVQDNDEGCNGHGIRKRKGLIVSASCSLKQHSKLGSLFLALAQLHTDSLRFLQYLDVLDQLLFVRALNAVQHIRHPLANLEQFSPGKPDHALLVDFLLRN